MDIDAIFPDSVNNPNLQAAKKIDLTSYQTHGHTFTCRKGGKQCRFGYPLPPMKETTILEPLKDISDEEFNSHKKNYVKIRNFLNNYANNKNKNIQLDHDSLLTNLEINQDDYILAIRSSLKRFLFFIILLVNIFSEIIKKFEFFEF